MLFALTISFAACEKIETENEEKESTSTDINSNDIDKNKDDEGGSDNGSGNGDSGSNDDTGGEEGDGGNDDGDNNDDGTDINGGGDNNGGSGDDDTEEPDDTGYQTGDIVSVSEFLKKDIKCEVWVVGRIVGDCTRSKKYAEFDAPFTLSQAILIADNPNEKDINNVVSVCLTTNKTMRRDLNLVDNPENKNEYVAVFGFRETYLGLTGIKKPCGYKFPVNIK